ncbi:unnamed protein product [Paramecium sonneborni]|uniref:RING-type domain-containing protein n=1 Tax=Paramecium sonneborni TaxID=65129 RepID=A0A8S1PSW3_9CILI|nr:unnamed protein product [Paramecium sonneborni]
MKTGKQILGEDIEKLQLIQKKINDSNLWKNPKIESNLQDINNRIQLILQILDNENKTEQQYQQMRNKILNDNQKQVLENLDSDTLYSYNLESLKGKPVQDQRQYNQQDITINEQHDQNPPQSQFSQQQNYNQKESNENDKNGFKTNSVFFNQNQQIIDDSCNSSIKKFDQQKIQCRQDQEKQTNKDKMELEQVENSNNNKKISDKIQNQNNQVKRKYEYKVDKEIYIKMKDDMYQFKMNIVDLPLNQEDGSISQCPICQEQCFSDSDIQDKYVVSLSCFHQYHYVCLQPLLNKNFVKCPICNQIFGQLTGDQPNGIMEIKTIRRNCVGYNCDTIQITYIFQNGKKNGKYYSGTTRYAYLPNNEEGQKVLKLLKKAFDQKLIFTIGTSLTTGQENCVVWNGIHHKTSLDGGPQRYGYPDPTYFDRVRDELKQKGIV